MKQSYKMNSKSGGAAAATMIEERRDIENRIGAKNVFVFTLNELINRGLHCVSYLQFRFALLSFFFSIFISFVFSLNTRSYGSLFSQLETVLFDFDSQCDSHSTYIRLTHLNEIIRVLSSFCLDSWFLLFAHTCAFFAISLFLSMYFTQC